MKKFAKLSLVAAVAVAGLSTSASAVALEEAIKGVDISGYVRYRMDDTQNNLAGKDGDSINENEYKILLKAKIPVNDNLKATLALSVKGDTDNQDNNSTTTSSSLGITGAGKPGVSVKCANFTYTMGATSVTAGQMAIKTPISGADAYGTGALALSTMGNVTLAAAYFLNSDGTDFDIDQKDILAAAAIGSFGPVNAQAWYFEVEDVLDSLVFTQVDGKMGPVAAKVQYITGEDTAGVDQGLWGLEVSGNVANVTLSAGYTSTDEDGARIALEDDASVIDAGEQSNVEEIADTESMFVTAMAKFGNISVGADYVSRTTDNGPATDTDVTETVLRAGYAMSKNFNVSAFYSMMEEETGSTTTVDKDQADRKSVV